MDLLEAHNRLMNNEITEEEAALALGMSLIGLREELARWGERITEMSAIIEKGSAQARDKALSEAQAIIEAISVDSKAGDNHGR